MNKLYSGVEDVHGHGSGNKKCFKALALEVHPDKGGTTKGMRALNDCNLWLRAPDTPGHKSTPKLKQLDNK